MRLTRGNHGNRDTKPNPVMIITDPLPAETYDRTYFVVRRLYIVRANIMVSTATIILVMLAAVLMVAAIIYGEWGHRY